MDKIQVLIVEDEVIVSIDLRYKLESLGYSVSAEVRSGDEAVAAASQLRPDVVLMDIGLSGAAEHPRRQPDAGQVRKHEAMWSQIDATFL